jgi:hypothetical protein
MEAVDWLGASCGGYLAIRAAAFEPRIKHIISLPTTYSGVDMTLKQMTPGKAAQLISLFKAGDRNGTEALVAKQRTPNSVFDWCITQGMHITGTRTPFDFLTAMAQHPLDGILHNVRQDILLTEGEQDHLFDVGGFTGRCASSSARVRSPRVSSPPAKGASSIARSAIRRWGGKRSSVGSPATTPTCPRSDPEIVALKRWRLALLVDYAYDYCPSGPGLTTTGTPFGPDIRLKFDRRAQT